MLFQIIKCFGKLSKLCFLSGLLNNELRVTSYELPQTTSYELLLNFETTSYVNFTLNFETTSFKLNFETTSYELVLRVKL